MTKITNLIKRVLTIISPFFETDLRKHYIDQHIKSRMWLNNTIEYTTSIAIESLITIHRNYIVFFAIETFNKYNEI